MLVACVGAWSTALAVESGAVASERRIKAAFLSRFADYVEWPEAADAGPGVPLRIGVLGDDPMVDELEALISSRSDAARPVEVLRVPREHASPPLHILYIGRADRATLGAAVVGESQPVLVVTDAAGLTTGATINYVVRNARVRFEVSLDDAERRHLKLGSGLLSVAVNVRRAGQ